MLDRSSGVGASWRARYEGLRLNSVRWMSGLPNAPIPRSAGRWPLKDEVIAHLERYVEERGLDVRLGVNADRIERSTAGWEVMTSAGPLCAPAVVVATGSDGVAKMPDWPGSRGFKGELTHGSDYRNPKPYGGRTVLIAGAGNTGTEIAVQLADGGAAKVWMAVRTPPNLVPIELWGLPASLAGALADRLPPWLVDRITPLFIRDLSDYGLPRSPYGLATEIRIKGLGAVLDRGISEALKSGRVQVVGPIERFEASRVVLADGTRLCPDVVIAATGYRKGLEPLVGHLGVLAANGLPLVNGGQTHPIAPRLYFNGYYQPIAGQLPQLRRTSRAIGWTEARLRRGESVVRRGRRRPQTRGALA